MVWAEFYPIFLKMVTVMCFTWSASYSHSYYHINKNNAAVNTLWGSHPLPTLYTTLKIYHIIIYCKPASTPFLLFVHYPKKHNTECIYISYILHARFFENIDDSVWSSYLPLLGLVLASPNMQNLDQLWFFWYLQLGTESTYLHKIVDFSGWLIVSLNTLLVAFTSSSLKE